MITKDLVTIVILTVILVILIIDTFFKTPGGFKTVDKIPPEKFLELAKEAYEWMMQFQITPPDYKWGWHTPCKEAWGGLAGYYVKGYKWASVYMKESSRQAYIASHDTGWFMELGVLLYKLTGNETYLQAAKLAAEWALRIQVGYSEWLKKFEEFYYEPVRLAVRISWKLKKPGIKFSEEVKGAFTEGMFFLSGLPPKFGKWNSETNFAEPATWIAPEHVTPLARGLLRLYEVTKNETYLVAAIRAAEFLMRMQDDEGKVYTCYPKEAYGPRMSDTADVAYFFLELYEVTKNRTFLERGLRACDFMIKSQVKAMYGHYAKVRGGLPHLSTAGGSWRAKSYFTSDAAAAILAWLKAYEITKSKKYLEAAVLAAEFILSLQETPPGYSWGTNLYSHDPRAIGGFYWCYYYTYAILPYQFTGTTSSAAYALVELYKYVKDERYLKAVSLAFNWLVNTDIRKPSKRKLKLPGLTVISDPYGLYKSGYIPAYGKYYDEVPGTMTGHPKQGFAVAMSASGPCYLYVELYNVFKKERT